MNEIQNSNKSYTGLVEKFVGTAYDDVKAVGDNLDGLLQVSEFMDDYLGPHRNAPTAGRNDSPLALGMYYLDTGTSAMKFHTTQGWVTFAPAAPSGGGSIIITPGYDAKVNAGGLFDPTLPTRPIPLDPSKCWIWIAATEGRSPIDSFVYRQFDILYYLAADANRPAVYTRVGQEGAQGIQGARGTNGTHGLAGTDGIAGRDGRDGVAGIQGPQGAKGGIGLTGTGTPGMQGPSGAQGPRGADGNIGDRGLTGSKGDRGDRGDLGLKGDKGDRGDTGPSGPAGTGDGGDGGAMGPKGDKGDTGSAGAPGGIGPRGDKGDKGDTGAVGPAGEAGTGDGGAGTIGPQGIQGVKGDRGDRGAKGDRGDTGAQGNPGPQGPMGPAGSGDGGGTATYTVASAFQTVALMKSGTSITGTYVRTEGYLRPGMGGALYEITIYQPSNMWGSHKISSNQWARFVADTVITPGQFGAVGDGKVNDVEAFRAATEWMEASRKESILSNWDSYAEQGYTLELGNHSYGLRNSQAEFDNGITSCIYIPPKCAIQGNGRGASMFVMLDGHCGHTMVNWNIDTYNNLDDFITLRDFSIYGRRWEYSTDHKYWGSGIKLVWTKGSLQQTDNFTVITNVRIDFVKGTACHLYGRGECIMTNCYFGHSEVGLFAELYDSQYSLVNCGGNRHSGIISKGASSRWVGCKAFYNGRDGEDSETQSSNWYLPGDGWTSGSQTYIGCEAQEGRGTGFYIGSGLNSFTNCLVSDPGRAALSVGSPGPDDAAHFYLAGRGTLHGAASYNVFSKCTAYPALTRVYSNQSTTIVRAPYPAISIGENVVGTVGDFTLYPTCVYEGGVLTGAGAAAKKNPRLTINGESTSLTGDHPAPSFAVEARQESFKFNISPGNSIDRELVWYSVKVESDRGPTFYHTFKELPLPYDMILREDDTGKALDPNASFTFSVASCSIDGPGPYSVKQTLLLDDQRVARPYYIQNTTTNLSGWQLNKDLVSIDDDVTVIKFSLRDWEYQSPLTTLFEKVSDDGNDVELRVSLVSNRSFRIQIGSGASAGVGVHSMGINRVNFLLGRTWEFRLTQDSVSFQELDPKGSSIGDGATSLTEQNRAGTQRTTAGLLLMGSRGNVNDYHAYNGCMYDVEINGKIFPMNDNSNVCLCSNDAAFQLDGINIDNGNWADLKG